MQIATLAVVLAIFAVQLINRLRGESILTVEGITEAIGTADDVWTEAQEWVAAAEQLWKSSQIPKQSRFDYVFEHLRERYPDLNTDIIKAAIEAGVFWLNEQLD
jgi:hypothetical protein